MAAPARAQVTKEPEAAIFPDPKKFASGFFTEGEVGTVAFMGPAGDAVDPGFAIGTRLGYDVFRFLAADLDEYDVFVCGPPPWMDAVTGDLRAAGVARDRIHTESFSI